MVNLAEKIVALNRANLETAVQAANIALAGAERLIELNLAATKTAIAEGARAAKAVTEVKDVKDLLAVQTASAEPQLEKAASFVRSVYEAIVQTQTDLAKLVEERIVDVNQELIAAFEQAAKTAPAGLGADAAVAAMKSAVAAATNAYDTLSKAAKQMAELTEVNMTAMASKAAAAKKKAA
ncbi:phasin family protein [Pelomicrobium methylotrophicum]|uniref:Phasin family protein n=1 Tax=Pelomicrobium methylotrophicum TaxID=2602750 RepID=A0A5C7F1S0_9PROT|nr:phasin family protein [Pelomicrobium methylotrophicum]TXF13423.1 phasin family protein [Pelomicrobium methylotrophicum]